MAPIFILRIGWNCVILQPLCLSNLQRNGEAPRGTLESWFRTRTTGCASRSMMPTRGSSSTPCLDLASCWNSPPQMQKRELAELLVGAAAHHERPAARHHRGGADRADDNSGCGDARPRRRSSRPSRTPSASLPNLPAQ